MNRLIAKKLPLAKTTDKTNPDVIVSHANQTSLFRPQNFQASEWLHVHCGLSAENITGNTEIRVHPRKCSNIIRDLTAAGFVVEDRNDET